ncbi:MAG TPA: hypothetical protein VN181_02855, partial [Thermoanaerobaculia bacterium]|nr:hypothetical protein [Thermoanaerobaculia bacterium]
MGDIRQWAQELAASEPAHLEFEQIAAYAEHSADAIDREIVESHVAQCAQCRRELRDLDAFLGVRRRRSPLWIAAAAMVILLFGAIFFATRRSEPRTLIIPRQALALRQSELALRGATRGQSLEPISPVGRIVVNDRPTFEWSAIPNARYRVEVFDERFRPVAASGVMSAA